MNCITPMIRFYQDIPKSYPDEKLGQKIIPRSQVYERLLKNENLIRGLDRLNKDLEKKGSVWRYQTIPCGHCYACQLRYSADWAIRIMTEVSKYEHNYFVTFTYDEINLPIPESTTYNGKTFDNPGDWTGTLWPDDITRFINSLRKRFERKGHNGIKVFWCGEYCPTSGRPHYHMILINCPLKLDEFYSFKLDPSTKKLHWKSMELEELWNKGFIDISEVNFSSAAYVARYCMKKLSTEVDKTSYYEQGKLPEFVRMSRRPGIGAEYFDENAANKIYIDDGILMKNFHGELAHYKPPKAWDRKFKDLYPEEWEKIKKSRQAAQERANSIIQEMTNATDLQKLDQKAREITTKGNQLKRSLEYEFS